MAPGTCCPGPGGDRGGDVDADREPLAAWAERRDRRRESDRQITGRRRAEPLDPAARGRAAHLAPNAPASSSSSTRRPASGWLSESPTTPPRPPPSSMGGDTTAPPEPSGPLCTAAGGFPLSAASLLRVRGAAAASVRTQVMVGRVPAAEFVDLSGSAAPRRPHP
ncbi:DUF6087 family protein [Streptomyces sp. NPDC059979]|uniref:DUF6087 family protein n=1 Tax=Streptomyces sp. NPDC059979 TaxID=3347021 RepID=UPI00368B03B5